MKVTDVRINYPRKKNENETTSKLRGYARIILDGQLAVNSIRLIETDSKRYLIFPERESNRKDDEGRTIMLSIANPVVQDLRLHIEESVWEAYDRDSNNPFLSESQ